MRAKIGMIAVLLFVVVGFTSSASACEKCTYMDSSLVKMCFSGVTNGVQWCYGGFGTDCTTGGVCGSGGGGLGDDPLSPDFAVAVQPCLTCTGDEPAQGFVLQREARSEALAEK